MRQGTPRERQDKECSTRELQRTLQLRRGPQPKTKDGSMNLTSHILIRRNGKNIFIQIKNEEWSNVPNLDFIEDVEILSEENKSDYKNTDPHRF
jgi:hypothetical protein